jgi:ATP/maltotriose-dependent transcriptional regulator MalT
VNDAVLIGEDRLRTLNRLGDIWEEVRSGGASRVAVLKGPKGSGRTLMLQSLYRICERRQPAPWYAG